MHYEGGKVPAYGSEGKLIVGSAPGNRAGSFNKMLRLMNINAKSEDVIIIKETIENGYVTRTVYSNGYMCYSQTKDLQLMKNRGNDTWVDSFYHCLNIASTSKGLDNVGDIADNSSDSFYFFSQRRFQSLNFKQKFFHFLLKKIFFHGESATIEQVKRALVNFQEESLNYKRNGRKVQ